MALVSESPVILFMAAWVSSGFSWWYYVVLVSSFLGFLYMQSLALGWGVSLQGLRSPWGSLGLGDLGFACWPPVSPGCRYLCYPGFHCVL